MLLPGKKSRKMMIDYCGELDSISRAEGFYNRLHAGDFFEEWNEITPQTQIRKGLIRLALGDSDQWD